MNIVKKNATITEIPATQDYPYKRYRAKLVLGCDTTVPERTLLSDDEVRGRCIEQSLFNITYKLYSDIVTELLKVELLVMANRNVEARESIRKIVEECYNVRS